jgi:hypothetical protein
VLAETDGTLEWLDVGFAEGSGRDVESADMDLTLASAAVLTGAAPALISRYFLIVGVRGAVNLTRSNSNQQLYSRSRTTKAGLTFPLDQEVGSCKP